jgi:hypothetical protein
VSTVSEGEAFTIVTIIENKEESDDDESDKEESAENNFGDTNIDNKVHEEFLLHDWVLVRYDNYEFAGEVTNIVGNEFEVNVMHKSGAMFWKWPSREDNSFSEKMLLKS